MNLALLGKKLKKLRTTQEKSLTEVAEALSIDRTYISKIESGQRKPSLQILNSLINFYKISSYSEFNEYLSLAAYPSIATAINSHVGIPTSSIGKEGNLMENNLPLSQQQGLQVNMPNGLQVLYTDSIFVTASAYGLVFDVAQSVGPTPNQTVVARLGMSLEHAEALSKVLVDKILEAKMLRKGEKNKQN